MAKKTTEEKINLESILFKCRDVLRKARNSGSFFEKRDMMLTLVFLRFIGEKFENNLLNILYYVGPVKIAVMYILIALVMLVEKIAFLIGIYYLMITDYP